MHLLFDVTRVCLAGNGHSSRSAENTNCNCAVLRRMKCTIKHTLRGGAILMFLYLGAIVGWGLLSRGKSSDVCVVLGKAVRTDGIRQLEMMQPAWPTGLGQSPAKVLQLPSDVACASAEREDIKTLVGSYGNFGFQLETRD